jgi:GNAT superfamily N-acetyltransferase
MKMVKKLAVEVMPFGFRRVGAASCRIGNPECLPVHMHGKVREVMGVLVPDDKRHQGYGTTLMHKVCREADDHGLTLFLKVQPFDSEPMDVEKLTDWYGKTFGFAVIQAEPRLMARMPWSTPSMNLPPMSPLARAAIATMKKDTAK